MHHSSVPYREILENAGLSLDEEQFRRLEDYAGLLLDWNSRVNLVSRKDEAHVWPGHLLHSLSLLFRVKVPEGVRIADLGSGGGLPGIPVAIALPRVEVVLIESIRKKCRALEDMVRRLGLANASVLNARAENAAAMVGHKQSFDLVIARAVAPLVDLVEWSTPLVRKGTLSIGLCGKEPEALPLPALIAMKGGSISEEIEAAKKATRPVYVRTSPIEFNGIESTGLVDKSLIIIGL